MIALEQIHYSVKKIVCSRYGCKWGGRGLPAPRPHQPQQQMRAYAAARVPPRVFLGFVATRDAPHAKHTRGREAGFQASRQRVLAKSENRVDVTLARVQTSSWLPPPLPLWLSSCHCRRCGKLRTVNDSFMMQEAAVEAEHVLFRRS